MGGAVPPNIDTASAERSRSHCSMLTSRAAAISSTGSCRTSLVTETRSASSTALAIARSRLAYAIGWSGLRPTKNRMSCARRRGGSSNPSASHIERTRFVPGLTGAPWASLRISATSKYEPRFGGQTVGKFRFQSSNYVEVRGFEPLTLGLQRTRLSSHPALASRIDLVTRTRSSTRKHGLFG